MGNTICPPLRNDGKVASTACVPRMIIIPFDEINSNNRREKWCEYIGIPISELVECKCKRKYEIAKLLLFKNQTIDYSSYPIFGSEFTWNDTENTNVEMKQSVIRLLLVFFQMYDIHFNPLLPHFLVMLMQEMEEDEIYTIISFILDNSTVRKKYFIINPIYQNAFIQHFLQMNNMNPSYGYLRFSQSHKDSPECIMRLWLSSLLHNIVDSTMNIRILDFYISYGCIGFMALLSVYLSDYGSYLTALFENGGSDLYCALQTSFHIKHLSSNDIESILYKAACNVEGIPSIEASVQQIMKTMIENEAKGSLNTDSKKYHLFNIIGSSRLLSRSLCSAIMNELPARIHLLDPHLLYTSYEDGYHLIHILEKANDSKPTLLLLQVKNSNCMIGIYREDRWSSNRSAYGISDTILMRIDQRYRKGEDTISVDQWHGCKPSSNDQLIVISDQFVDGVEKPINYVYIRSPSTYLMVGAGGRKGISFYLSEDFTKAYSQQSEVFQNPPLFKDEFFSVANAELFEFISCGI